MENHMQEFIGILGTVFMMGGFAPYLLALWRKQARPHAFSWLSWGLINAIIFTVQLTENAGPGAWTAGIAGFFNIGIGLYAIRGGERNITKTDWAVFITVLSAIPLWVLTKDPVWSVVLVSVIDTLAFIPTLRKSWHRPHEEVAATFVLGMLGFICALVAIENHSFTNVCYPVKVLVTNSIFIGTLLYRRRALAGPDLRCAEAV
jgi:uncharacterized membrane protein HdeD (DUF308 family)